MERQEVISFLKKLQDDIIGHFESFETDKKFQKKTWDHISGGGGEMAVIRGDVFEKAAVNWSGVEGPDFPMEDGSGPFFATGISLITHMKNPHAPTLHMNIRYIETKKSRWLGGGYDLTPMGYPYEEDTLHFHQVAKKTLDPFGKKLYPLFSEQAKEYFFIPHRKRERGVGGIFFDHFTLDPFEEALKMWRAVGKSLIPAILPIYKKRTSLPFSDQNKLVQLEKRGHYAEFNLAYDRGTKFGFLSGGNPEAILCSLPPVATW